MKNCFIPFTPVGLKWSCYGEWKQRKHMNTMRLTRSCFSHSTSIRFRIRFENFWKPNQLASPHCICKLYHLDPAKWIWFNSLANFALLIFSINCSRENDMVGFVDCLKSSRKVHSAINYGNERWIVICHRQYISVSGSVLHMELFMVLSVSKVSVCFHRKNEIVFDQVCPKYFFFPKFVPFWAIHL